MLSDIWFPLIVVCGIAWITCIFMSSRSSTQPPLPPGPMGLPVVGMLPFMSPQLHTYFTHLTQTYGPLMSLRLGKKTVVVVSSPFLAKQVFKDFDVTFASHDVSAAAREFSLGGNDILFAPYGPKWRMLRKVSANGMLGHAALDAVCNQRSQWIDQAIRHLHENAGCPIDIGEQMFLMAFDMIMSSLWEKTSREGQEFRRVVTRSVELLGVPNVSDFFPGLAKFDLQGIVKEMQDCIRRLDGMMEAVIEECKEKDDKNEVAGNKGFLQFLLPLKDKDETEAQLTMAQVKGVLVNMIVAGTDTSSNTIEFSMAEIVNKPEVMRKAQQELEAVVGADNRVEESHIHQLPYLQAIMKETLRLHPTVPLLIPHRPSQSCIVGGYTIPEGLAVFINVWAIHRDPSLWEDPQVFKPERFLNNKYDFSGNNFNYLPFGAGRRICAGVALAERMIMLPLASLLHYFDWKLPHGVEKLDLSEKFGVTMKKAKPLLLIPSPRLSHLGKPYSSNTTSIK